MTKFDKIYKSILKKILTEGKEELNKRTGQQVKALPGICFNIDLEKDGFPLLSLRKLNCSFIPEIMWMLNGSNRSEWLTKHTKIWDLFIEKNGIITSAYGFRWKYHFKVDQIKTVISKLSKNKSDRHCVVLMWSPLEDLLIKQKNVPCPFTFTLNIIEDKLNLHLIIRSNDMILGNPTDVAGFAFLQHIIAQKLSVKVGVLTVSISNAHIYGNHYEIATELIKRNSKTKLVTIKLPGNTLKKAQKLDSKLIKGILIENYLPNKPIKNIIISK